MALCKLCESTVPVLVRCHIYPRSMSQEIAGPDKKLVSMSIKHGARVAQAHGGIYDDQIVCAECERLFKPADDVGIEFRRMAISDSSPCQLPFKTVSLPQYTANASLLHTFAMQTWLRSHFSDRDEHEQIEDHRLAEQIRKNLLHGKGTIKNGPSVAIRVCSSPLAATMIPGRMRDHPDYPFYQLGLPNMDILIAASDRGLPLGFSHICLKQGPNVLIWRVTHPDENYLKEVADAYEPNSARVDRIFDK